MVHCEECEEIASRAAVALEPAIASGRIKGGVLGGVYLEDVRGGVAGDVSEGSAASGIRAEGLNIIDDKHNSEDFMFWFESST